MKSLESHINESLQDTRVITQILDSLEPRIKAMVDASKKSFIEQYGSTREWLPYHDEWTRLMLIYKLCGSIETYTQPGDKLVSIESSRIQAGLFTINAQIARDGIEYGLVTTVTRAGGYNIQCAHYRYLTATRLPKTGRSVMTSELADKMKRMSKGQRILIEIEQYEQRIQDKQKILDDNKSLTEDQKIRYMTSRFNKPEEAERMYGYMITQHHEINKESHNWTMYGHSKEAWDIYQKNRWQEKLRQFDDAMKMIQNDIKSFEKTIAKLNVKLAACQ